jgi:biofilm PGA synthesis N-glycosyltransferase PgaC
LFYRNPGNTISGKGESIYWKYETALKQMESKLGYVAGANGAIYAIRRDLFETFPPRAINDDFTLSMKIVMKGFKSLYDENAIVYEDVAPTMQSEFNRHVRDGAGHYIAVVHLLGLLNPLLGLRSFIYWSHRIFRWMIPFLLILLFMVNISLLDEWSYRVLFILQCIFYSVAVIGWVGIKKANMPFLIYVPFYFCNLNAALFLGFLRAAANVQKTTWERTERTP